MKADLLTTPDSELDDMERHVPELAHGATFSAHSRALAASPRGVLTIEAGNLVRVTRDGRKTVIAKAKPRRKVKLGEVITVRRIQGTSAGA